MKDRKIMTKIKLKKLKNRNSLNKKSIRIQYWGTSKLKI